MNYFIIDFDSTFIKNESLDILFEISDPNNNDKIREIKKITDLGMNGHISFSESLKRRIKLLEASRKDIDKAVNNISCLLYTSPSPRDEQSSRMPSSA